MKSKQYAMEQPHSYSNRNYKRLPLEVEEYVAENVHNLTFLSIQYVGTLCNISLF